MKKLIAFIFAWLLYYIGHFISLIMLKFDFVFLYIFYNKCMNTSLKIQDWAGLKTPWSEKVL